MEVEPQTEAKQSAPEQVEAKPSRQKTRQGASAAAAAADLAKIDVAALAPVLEAILLSVDRPVQADRLAEGLGLVRAKGEGEDAVCDPGEVATAVAGVDAAVRSL